MTETAAAITFALFVWWFSTGVALYLVRLPDRALNWTMAASCGVFLGALLGIWQTANLATPAAAYLAFTMAILIWGVIEIGFLTGAVTGPWRRPCPVNCGPWQRTGYAILAILYNELLLIAAGAAIAALTWDAANQFAWWTFAILWLLRVSAKLNVFLGVPILNAELLPPRVRFIGTFFRQRPINALFPISITAATLATILLAQQVSASADDAFNAVGFSLLATLMALALIEHWFMVLPLPVIAIWKWGLRNDAQNKSPTLLTDINNPSAVPATSEAISNLTTLPLRRRRP